MCQGILILGTTACQCCSEFSLENEVLKLIFFIGKFGAAPYENSAILLQEWPESCDPKVPSSLGVFVLNV